MSFGETSYRNNRLEPWNNLTALLYSLKEDATWAWKQSMDGHSPDLFNLNRAWELVVKEVQRLEREGK